MAHKFKKSEVFSLQYNAILSTLDRLSIEYFLHSCDIIRFKLKRRELVSSEQYFSTFYECFLWERIIQERIFIHSEDYYFNFIRARKRMKMQRFYQLWREAAKTRITSPFVELLAEKIDFGYNKKIVDDLFDSKTIISFVLTVLDIDDKTQKIDYQILKNGLEIGNHAEQ